jgi:hypothetical protein
MIKTSSILLSTLSVSLLASCGGMQTMAAPDVPAAIAVPAGHKMAMRQVGAGDLTYECRAKAGTADHEWVFAGPNAVLYDADRKAVGKYYGGPTWESSDGSKVTGKQLAVSPGRERIDPAATGAGQSRQRFRRDEWRDLHPAREHAGRRCAFGCVRRVERGHEADGEIPGRLRVLQGGGRLLASVC